MLLPENTHPTNSLYFNGGYILQALKQTGEIKLMDLYMEARQLRDMSMAIFVLALDWLFLAELVSFDDQGNIKPCF
jgi:hypothetical protein